MCVDTNPAGVAAHRSNFNSTTLGSEPSRHPPNVSMAYASLLEKPATHSEQRYEVRKQRRAGRRDRGHA